MRSATALICIKFMDFLSALIHLGNFIAPALLVPLLLWWPARWVFGKAGSAPRFWRHWPLQCAVCLAVLIMGLVVLQRDGRMLTYVALVVACASCQWLALRGWRR